MFSTHRHGWNTSNRYEEDVSLMEIANFFRCLISWQPLSSRVFVALAILRCAEIIKSGGWVWLDLALKWSRSQTEK